MATPKPHLGDRPAYGIDAPGIMFGLLIGGGGPMAAGAAELTHRWHWPGFVVLALGALPFAFGILMTVYWLVGKRRTRDRMLGLIAWRGDEAVLDVGTGAGFLMAGAAKRAPRGRVTGVDSWSAKDLSNNAPATTARNMAIEGVAARCDVVTGDARDMAFADGSFDVVVSLLCIHNIEGRAEQARACHEIARVLKPGGRVVIGDYLPTHAYASALQQAGLTIRQSNAAFATALSLMWIVVADKPI